MPLKDDIEKLKNWKIQIKGVKSMKIFEHPTNINNFKCFICNGNDDKPVTLIGIDGTEDGYNREAMQVHIDCLNLSYSPKEKIFYMIM